MSEIGSITVGIRGDASDLIDEAHRAEVAVETLNEAFVRLKQQTAQISMPSFAYKFKNDYFNWDKSIFNNMDKTENLSLKSQIEYWQDMIGKYSYDKYAVMQSEEKICELFRELSENSNVLSENYIEERTHLNDWESFGDDAISAFERFNKNNEEFARQGIISWGEYYDNVDAMGEKMYSNRVKQSKEWLEQEYNYNDLSVDDYISGLERMMKYTEEYYDESIISYSTFADGKRIISNEIYDMRKVKEKQTAEENAKIYANWKSSSDGYLRQRELYGDWEIFGDNKVDFYERCIERQKEFFSQGIIDWETYNGAVINYSMELYKTQYSEFDKIVDELMAAQKQYINGIDEEYSQSISSFKSRHSIEKNSKELDEMKNMRSIYQNAVTQKGKDRLKKYSDEIYELEYQNELYKRETDRDKVMKEFKAAYETAEQQKEMVLSELVNGSIGINEVAERLSNGVFGECDTIQEILSKILTAINNSKRVVYGPTNYNISGADTSVFNKFVRDASGSLSYSMR